MSIFDFFKKKKKVKKSISDFKPLIDLIKNNNKTHITVIKEYKKDNHIFKLGDKVITKSNECNPYVVGKIVEFWDNEGKWTNCIPQVKDKNGKVWTIMGIIKPYTKDLEDKIKDIRPLEQWNYFVSKPYKYTEEEIDKKESKYNSLQKIKKKFVN